MLVSVSIRPSATTSGKIKQSHPNTMIDLLLDNADLIGVFTSFCNERRGPERLNFTGCHPLLDLFVAPQSLATEQLMHEYDQSCPVLRTLLSTAVGQARRFSLPNLRTEYRRLADST